MLNRTFLTADLHLSHSAIIRYTGRPYINAHEMDLAILKNWNEVVPEDGEVYILGDVSFGSPGYTSSILTKMNGKKYLVRGNHDRHVAKIAYCFEWIKDYHELIVQDERNKHTIVLSHFCFRVWNKSHHGSFHAFGHSHGGLEVPNSLCMDVGVDCNNFYPISLAAFIAKMKEKRDMISNQFVPKAY